MFMLMTYDVEAKRTEKFKKLLRRYLNHEQYSVFTGDITDAQAIKLRRDIEQVDDPRRPRDTNQCCQSPKCRGESFVQKQLWQG